ncbi:MAG: TadE family protein, partial [candidate division WOR-3 bacterium]
MSKKRRGQVMVEAAIGMALFLMLTLGAIETARFALRRIQITYASFQANRVAIVNKGDTTAVRKALQSISTHIKDAK